jgi:hypothetical protein
MLNSPAFFLRGCSQDAFQYARRTLVCATLNVSAYLLNVCVWTATVAACYLPLCGMRRLLHDPPLGHGTGLRLPSRSQIAHAFPSARIAQTVPSARYQ